MTEDVIQADDPEGRLDEAVAAYLQAAEAGRSPDRAEWLARYPDVAGELERFFEGNERLDRLAAPLRLLAVPPVGAERGEAGARSGAGRHGRGVRGGADQP